MNTQVDLLQTPIEFLKGVGPKRADVLRKEFEIFTFEDLLLYYPYRHIDKSKIYKIADIQSEGAYIQLKGKIVHCELVGQQRGKRLVAQFVDETGSIELVWFNGIRWVQDMLKENREFIVFGKPTQFNRHWNITHPELIDPKNQPQSLVSTNFQPLYNTSDKAKRAGLDSKAISKLVMALLPQVKDVIRERLSEDILQHLKLMPLKEALCNIHYPADMQVLSQAQLRLKFDELFFTQLKLLKLKLLTSQKYKGHVFSVVGDYFNTFYKNYLPFPLTNAQKRVIKEIRADMGSGRQMNRLLQGDVGSGKTITALLLMLIAKDNGFQSCLMAPTEILATQHYETVKRMLAPMEMRVEFLSGSTKTAKRREIHEGLRNGEVDILIGTHALIEDEVQFKNLGFVVIDEQHRFGVEQRAKLWKKNIVPPHILVMTATPNGFLKKEIAKGRQVFVVYPLIKESEKMDLQDLMAGYEAMSQAFPLPEYALGIVHGKMKPEEKDFEMQRFIKNETQILLSTTVIEVGIDVPNATVMVVENAERFGLSQLHQLRGRVGRGGEQSYCILMSGNKLTTESKQRLDAMVSTNDGFEIANIDLKLRGPGDLQGTQQSGILDFKLADLIRDEKLVAYTRNLAMNLLDNDPDLSKPQNAPIARHLAELMRKNVFWGMIS